MNKVCLECGEKIVGREDKKFCSDGCRNAYNNKINKDDESNNEEGKLINSSSFLITTSKIGTSKLKIVCKNSNQHFSK
jgi:hypothetical protein